MCFLRTGAAQGLVFSVVSMLGLGHEGSSKCPHWLQTWKPVSRGCRLWARKSPESCGSCSFWVWKGIPEKEGNDYHGKHRQHSGELTTCSLRPPLTLTRDEQAGSSLTDRLISLESLVYKLGHVIIKPGTSLPFPSQVRRKQRLIL